MKKLFICFIINLAAIFTLGQENVQIRPSEVPANCEISQRKLDTLHELAGNGNIIIISRLGRNESSEILNEIRLNAIRNYLIRAWGHSSEKIILARGEKVVGLGRLDFYINGNLIDTIVARKKKNIPTFCNSGN